ncbi:MAG: hypothetical protein SFW63_08275 [Alphaproteobacteria bacterium]|nr:hypothetical protein [Alphaproteobacteria bacterium]
MPRKNVPQLFGGSYRVYRSSRDFVVVEADSALEALERSGLHSAVKIERESMDNISVLSAAAWRTGVFSAPPAQTPAPTDAAPAAASAQEAKDTILLDVPQTAPAADQPLSNDDVEKLLKN